VHGALGAGARAKRRNPLSGRTNSSGKLLAETFAMPRAHLICFLSIALGGCFSSKGDAGDAGTGSAPPFTNGVSTLAGAANAGDIDGDRDIARFSNPVNVALGPDGKIYVSDFNNGKIRVTDSTGTTTTLIAQMGFARPFGLVFSGDTLYCTTDANNQGAHTPGTTGSVWQVDTAAKTATEIVDSIGMPRGIGVLASGELVLSDYENQLLETVNPATKQVTVIAGAIGQAGDVDGCGAAARVNGPYGLVVRSDGTVVFVEQGNNKLRVLDPTTGCVTSFAGTGTAGYSDGAIASAQFSAPEAIAIDSAGNLYIADSGNYRVREITGTTSMTIAGNGTAGYADEDDRTSAELYGLEGISVASGGSMVYVADGTRGADVPYNRVRQVNMQ
jgi:sugar lactone lactonase YvrE